MALRVICSQDDQPICRSPVRSSLVVSHRDWRPGLLVHSRLLESTAKRIPCVVTLVLLAAPPESRPARGDVPRNMGTFRVDLTCPISSRLKSVGENGSHETSSSQSRKRKRQNSASHDTRVLFVICATDGHILPGPPSASKARRLSKKEVDTDIGRCRRLHIYGYIRYSINCRVRFTGD